VADRLSLYDYLAFVVPGAMILFVAVYGYDGWPRGEPGVAGTVALTAASFVVGYINAALGNWLQPMFLGGKPGGRADSLWGTLGACSHYTDAERDRFTRMLTDRYDDLPPGAGFHLAYTELQQRGLDGPLVLMNQHIGFTRGTATATAVGLTIDIGLALTSGTHLPLVVWGPILLSAMVPFVMRYRRFWRRFGDQVLRGIYVLPDASGGS